MKTTVEIKRMNNELIFSDANLLNADIRDANLLNADIRDANLLNADIRDAYMEGVITE